MSDYWLAYQQPWVIVAIIAIPALGAFVNPAIVDTIGTPIMVLAFITMSMLPVWPGITPLRSLFQL